MNISLNNIGKKYNREWIFRNVDLQIKAGTHIVLLGGNGAGKSTFLQIISGFIIPNQGEVIYQSGTKKADQEEIKKFVSLASPYIQLIDEFSLKEIVGHTAQFKPFINKLTSTEVIDIIGLAGHDGKPFRQFSSGMKQRVKLGLAILADTPVLMLDEPLSNLDASGVAWYSRMIATYCQRRTVVVCSNTVTAEYDFCTVQFDISKYKP